MEKSKVAVVACPDYEPARVKESLQKGLEAIGGLESLIAPDRQIAIREQDIQEHSLLQQLLNPLDLF